MVDRAEGHADHDPMLVASLLDGDLDALERASAQARIDQCADCAALYADLLALSVATRAQPAAERPRDYRLSAADAARLRAEPVPPIPRLTGVMTETSSSASAHAGHDTVLVSSLADHSLAPTERAAAESLVASCSDCAALHADLMTLVAATRAMPTLPRPADYTLTPADAARLRGSWWRRLAGAIGSSHDGVSRPLAVGLSTLGLVGILIASAPTVIQLPAGLGGSAASSTGGQAAAPVANPAAGSADDSTGKAAPGAALPPRAGGAAAAPSAVPDRAALSPVPAYGVTVQPNPAASARPENDASGEGAGTGAVGPSPADLGTTSDVSHEVRAAGPDPLLLVSASFLLVGLGLFVLRWRARRLGDG